MFIFSIIDLGYDILVSGKIDKIKSSEWVGVNLPPLKVFLTLLDPD